MPLHSSNSNLLESNFEPTKYLLDTIQKGYILPESSPEKSHSEPTQKSELALTVRQHIADIVYLFYEKFSLNLVTAHVAEEIMYRTPHVDICKRKMLINATALNPCKLLNFLIVITIHRNAIYFNTNFIS